MQRASRTACKSNHQVITAISRESGSPTKSSRTITTPIAPISGSKKHRQLASTNGQPASHGSDNSARQQCVRPQPIRALSDITTGGSGKGGFPSRESDDHRKDGNSLGVCSRSPPARIRPEAPALKAGRKERRITGPHCTQKPPSPEVVLLRSGDSVVPFIREEGWRLQAGGKQVSGGKEGGN